jgi:hypothetical protein
VISVQLLTCGPLVLAWLAVAYRLPVLWRPVEQLGLRAPWGAHLALALALTFLWGPVYVLTDSVAGVPNLSRLLAHSLVLVGCWCVQVYFVHLALPPKTAHRRTLHGGLALLVALVLMGVFFRVADIHEEDAVDFTGHFAGRPFVLEYRLVFLAYLGCSMLILITLARRYAPIVRDRASLFLGLQLLGLAGWFALGYVVLESSSALSERLGLPYPLPRPDLAKQVVMAISLALLLIGATLPAWGPRTRLASLWTWLERYRACRHLYPLWRDLCSQFPELALVEPDSAIADALAFHDVNLRLVRRAMEIRDAELALRAFLPWGTVAAVRAACNDAGLGADETRATVEAASLAAALRQRSRGAVAPTADIATEPTGGSDLDEEVMYLSRVATAYATSPIVRRYRIQATAAHTIPRNVPA